MESKKITRDERDSIGALPGGRMHKVRILILSLAVGEIAHVKRTDWKWKRQTPARICTQIEKQQGWKLKCEKAADGSGWFVERLE